MASLKEIRARISSVKSTMKITSAMKMVSAAKLHKAENTCLKFLPYKNKLSESLSNYISSTDIDITIPLAEDREVKRVAIIIFSSNSGLCGTFNSNIINLFNETVNSYSSIGKENILIYTVGKKITDYVNKSEYTLVKSFSELYDAPTYAETEKIANRIGDKFINKEVDRVELIFNHYKNAGVQIPTKEILLPLKKAEQYTKGSKQKQNVYLVEPSKEEFLRGLVPAVVRTQVYGTLLDSLTAEHGARTTAMQIASENAEEMISTITQQYNKVRQEVITNEILDIVGGSEALRNK